MRKGEPVLERHAEMIHEFERRSAGASLFPIVENTEGGWSGCRKARRASIALHIARNSQG